MKNWIIIALLSIFALTSGQLLAQKNSASKAPKNAFIQKKATKPSNNVRPKSTKKQKVAKVQTRKSNATRRKQTPQKSNN